jgi:glycosyltransferase involved in cell wall biosynthesis
MSPKISVCIPAYNRASVLHELLGSILSQNYSDYEIVICEDKSPERKRIRDIIAIFIDRYPNIIAYYENKTNLGYDANLREVISKATGAYCFFMGNDDWMCPGALSSVALALKRYENIGVVLRSYASFDKDPNKIKQVFKYFNSEKFFPAGSLTISTFYRRSVVIPGMVLHREEALKYSTDHFDGYLLYQLYLVGNILVEKNGVYLPEITVLYRDGGIPYFGNSDKEKGKFVPKIRTPESSLHFMQGMLAIALYIEKTRGVRIYKKILSDIGNYSYPILALQSGQPFREFLRYTLKLALLGLGKNLFFYFYFFSIILIGKDRIENIIKFIKRRFGYTPRLGSFYTGKNISTTQ